MSPIQATTDANMPSFCISNQIVDQPPLHTLRDFQWEETITFVNKRHRMLGQFSKNQQSISLYQNNTYIKKSSKT